MTRETVDFQAVSRRHHSYLAAPENPIFLHVAGTKIPRWQFRMARPVEFLNSHTFDRCKIKLTPFKGGIA